MTEVVRSIDVRAFPMEIAKQMLTLAPALNMKSGVVGYHEAEMKLKFFLETLSTYHRILWPDQLRNSLFNNQSQYVTKFITLKEYSPMLKAGIARQLLDSIHFFPTTDPLYTHVLGDDELNE
jgi:hypothetical protein